MEEKRKTRGRPRIIRKKIPFCIRLEQETIDKLLKIRKGRAKIRQLIESAVHLQNDNDGKTEE